MTDDELDEAARVVAYRSGYTVGADARAEAEGRHAGGHGRRLDPAKERRKAEAHPWPDYLPA